jgi:hypothetical protein
MSDVIFLSSVFGQTKIAEPMGACILASQVRRNGRTAEIIEPSVHGWTVAETVREIAAHDSSIVAISVLRDKNVHDVLEFVSALRVRCPDRFILMGGHGPSISLAGIPDGTVVDDYLSVPDPLASGQRPSAVAADAATCSTTLGKVSLERIVAGPVVNPEVCDRGKGAADLDSPPPGPRQSTYFDVTPDYLAICREINAVMIGESDENFPVLVDRVLTGASWNSIAGVAYIEKGIFRKNHPPAKVRNLDSLPFMARDVLQEYHNLYRHCTPASILASRGCFYKCTFCSVARYERLQAGVNHRQRSNANIVQEIVSLHGSLGVTSFNFEDDNFIVKNRAGFEKIDDLCDKLAALPFKIKFTLFCRADVVREDLFDHLRQSGLTGVYFGMESAYEGDLEFFHKGLSVSQMFAALDTLKRTGFSTQVGAPLRVMLGYITWHPLTSFASLRATLSFVRRYQAPPKLLRRKLRLYTGTEILQDVARLGLLDGDHPDGWQFRDRMLDGLDVAVNNLSAQVNRRRGMLRTLEKAGSVHGYPLEIADFTKHRQYLDSFLYAQFDRLVTVAELAGGRSDAVGNALHVANDELDSYIADHDLMKDIKTGYQLCGFDPAAVDLFRK